jgi:WD40 repeat protein
MDFDDIISLVNQTVITDRKKPLSDVQRVVLRGAWNNLTYSNIAAEVGGYTEDYLKRDVGPKLWQLLSEVTGYTVKKNNIRNAMLQWAAGQTFEADPAPVRGAEPTAAPQEPPPTPSRLALCQFPRIDVSEFSGRQQEQQQLIQWIAAEGCRLVLLWGLPDIGKTSLAIKVAEQVRSEFDQCAYLELHPGLTPEAFLQELTSWLAEAAPPQTSWEGQLDWVMDQLARRRCLLMVDNGEVLFEPHQLAGTFRPDCLAYQDFLERVARLVHQSCVVWISRERPKEFAALGGRLVQAWEVGELSATEAEAFLMAQGWPTAPPEAWQTLVERYSGSPRLLKSLTPHLQMIHGGNLIRFLEDEVSLPDQERRSLSQILSRLSAPERQLLYWLALAQEPVALRELNSSMVPPPTADGVQSLLGRALCHQAGEDPVAGPRLDLNPAVRRLATEQAVQALAAELVAGQVDLLHQLPLLRVTAAETVQARQLKFGVQPLAQALEQRYPSEAALGEWVQRLHQGLRSHFLNQPGYGAGNLMHLCQALDISLTSFDFSNLCIWQANLQQVSLQGANLSQVRFQDTVFATALGRDLVVSFSQDGQTLAVGDHEGCLLHWELQRGRLLRFLEDSNAKAIRSLAFSPQDDLLAVGSADGSIQLWLLSSASESDLLYGHQAPVQALAFNREGDLLATGDAAGCLILWDLSSGTPRQTLASGGEPIRCLQFNKAGTRLISGGESHSVSLWEVLTGALIWQFQVQSTAWVRTVGFMPAPAGLGAEAGTEVAFAAGYDEACLCIWDVEKGRPIRVVPMATGTLPAIAVSGDGRFLAFSRPDRTVAIWDVVNHRRHHQLDSFDLAIWGLTFSPNGRLLVTASDYQVKVWDVATGICQRSLGSQRYSLKCLTFDSESTRLITGHDDTLLRSWQVNVAGAFARRPRSLRGHSASVRSVAASPGGHWLASSGEDRTIRLWQTGSPSDPALPRSDASRGSMLTARILTDDLVAPATSLAFSEDGRWLASGGEDPLVRLWSLDLPQPQEMRLAGHTGSITALAFGPNGQLISGSRDRTLRLWQVSDGQCLQVLAGHQSQVHGVSLSPDGQRLLSASRDGTVRWWHLASGQCQGVWQSPPQFWLQGCLVDQQGRLVAIASNDALDLELWSVTENRLIETLSGHSHEVWNVCVSPDRRYLATASQDEEIRIWRLDLYTCEQVLRPDRPYEGVNIRGAKGLTEPEEQMLRSLGALVSY